MRLSENTEGKGRVEIPLALFAGVFFGSGFAALLYQVVWQRLLVFFTGADVYASTLIVGAFMAGLGLGAFIGGRLADAVAPRRAVLLFAGAELGIAVFSLLSKPLYYDFLYQRLGAVALSPWAVTGVLFLSLLIPTALMGMSLPLLARALTDRIERAAWTVGGLYTVNTLGAAAGAFITTWCVLPFVGFAGALYVGAAVNFACGIAVLPFRSRLSATLVQTAITEGMTANSEGSRDGRSLLRWALIYSMSGFVALSLEIVWFRLLGVMVKSTSFTFGTLLGVYLSGLGLGAALGSLLAARVNQPSRLFLVLQAAVALSAVGLLTLLVGAVSHFEWLHAHFASYSPLSIVEGVRRLRRGEWPWDVVFLYAVLPSLLIGLPTLLMGFSFPILQRIVQTDLAQLGRRIGLLLLANIAGSVAGSMVTGWVALNLLGTSRTLQLLGMCGSLFLLAAAAGLPGARRKVAIAITAVIAAVTWAATPDSARLWGRLHGTTADSMIAGEDATGLSVLRMEAPSSRIRTTVFVNGLGQSTVPFGDVHTALGMVPVLLHPAPRRVAIIGLGSGDTLYAASSRTETVEIASIEIVRPQLPGLRQLRSRLNYPALPALLGDPRIRWLAGDGRAFLMRESARFDVIEADALRPSSAYAGNLYSKEYFELVRARLSPGGLAATWSPTSRVHNAFVTVFPHVVSVPGILVGSNEAISLNENLIAERLRDPRVREHYARAGINAEEMIAAYFQEPAIYSPASDRTAMDDINTDLFPKDEFRSE